MKKHAILTLTALYLTAHATNQQTGPTAGAGTQVLPGNKTEIQTMVDYRAFNNKLENEILMNTASCTWSKFMGDIIPSCTIDAGVNMPEGMRARMEGMMLFKCGAQVLRSTHESIDYSVKSNVFKLSGPSFEYDNMVVYEDARYQEKESKGELPDKSQVCAASKFSILFVPIKIKTEYSHPKTQKKITSEFNGFERLSDDNMHFQNQKALIREMITGSFQQAYTRCINMNDENKCQKTMKVQLQIYKNIPHQLWKSPEEAVKYFQDQVTPIDKKRGFKLGPSSEESIQHYIEEMWHGWFGVRG